MVNPADLERLCAAVERVIKESDQPRVVMSFTNVKHIPSVFLGKIISFHKRVQAKGGSFELVNVSSDIYELFRVTKLTSLVTITLAGQPRSPLGAGAPPPSWVAALVVTGVSALLGLAMLIRAIVTHHWPGGVGLAALIVLALLIPSPGAAYFGRDRLGGLAPRTQWAIVGVAGAIAGACLVVLLLA